MEEREEVRRGKGGGKGKMEESKRGGKERE